MTSDHDRINDEAALRLQRELCSLGRPSDMEIVQVIADHYGVELVTAAGWLRGLVASLDQHTISST